MTEVLPVDDAAFEAQVLKSDVPVLVEFGAPWCPPCRAIEPHVEALAQAYAGRVRVRSVDTDANTVMSARFGIRGLPTVILFKDGRPVDSVVGAVPKRKLEELILRHLQ